MSSTIVVSISGVRDKTVADAQRMIEVLQLRGIPVSVLAAPRRGREYRLKDDALAQEWLRGYQATGGTVVLHGYDQAATKSRRAEFASLPRHEANLRLLAADRVMRELGLRTDIFAPPRWIASPGSIAALPERGFRVCADLTTVRDFTTGEVLRSRVVGLGDGFLSEPWWCRALVMTTAKIARRGGIARINVSAKQLAQSGPVNALVDAVDIALHHGAVGAVYGTLTAPAAEGEEAGASPVAGAAAGAPGSGTVSAPGTTPVPAAATAAAIAAAATAAAALPGPGAARGPALRRGGPGVLFVA